MLRREVAATRAEATATNERVAEIKKLFMLINVQKNWRTQW
jgi:hypothetical protein